VSNANEAILFVSMATSFNGFIKDPAKNGLDKKAIVKKQLTDVFAKSYQTLKDGHLKDYQSFFNRVSLDLDEKKVPDLPTDERLKRYTWGADITSPSTSPENSYITPDGFKGATLYGATSDLAMIRECFKQTIQASIELDMYAGLRNSLEIAMNQLYPYQIGRKGNLQEWYHDWEDAEPQHRHQTHLYGLYPGHQITPAKTPELADACRKTLEIKGDETTGWSKGWHINLWARLWDGNRAYKLFRELLSYVEPDGAKNINYGGGSGTYPNLFDAHSPFQIDGNFGGAAGVIEMLMQSDEEEIYMLPALPDAWQSGSVSGICARGGFELSMKWKEGKLDSVEVLSKAGNECRLNYNGKVVTFGTEIGGSYHLDSMLNKKQ
jgi:alpha-L-fucosidase 2